MKRILFAVTAFLLMGSSAFAQAYSSPSALFNWTGFYVGGTAGYSWGHTKVVFPHTPQDDSPFFYRDGATGGVTGGYNFQYSAFVFGIETDYSAGRLTAMLPSQAAFGCGVGTPCNGNVDWFGTVRGRIGYAFDRFLPYLTGGWAYGRTFFSIGSCPGGCFHREPTGWTTGAGVEMAFAPNWSAKIEYLFVDLGTTLNDSGGVGNTNRMNVLRAGLNYRFGGN